MTEFLQEVIPDAGNLKEEVCGDEKILKLLIPQSTTDRILIRNFSRSLCRVNFDDLARQLNTSVHLKDILTEVIIKVLGFLSLYTSSFTIYMFLQYRNNLKIVVGD